MALFLLTGKDGLVQIAHPVKGVVVADQNSRQADVPESPATLTIWTLDEIIARYGLPVLPAQSGIGKASAIPDFLQQSEGRTGRVSTLDDDASAGG